MKPHSNEEDDEEEDDDDDGDYNEDDHDADDDLQQHSILNTHTQFPPMLYTDTAPCM
jgi:hypothetical protein